jgi:hypothetical protein
MTIPAASVKSQVAGECDSVALSVKSKVAGGRDSVAIGKVQSGRRTRLGGPIGKVQSGRRVRLDGPIGKVQSCRQRDSMVLSVKSKLLGKVQGAAASVHDAQPFGKVQTHR